MARYRHIDMSPRLLPVDLRAQLVTGEILAAADASSREMVGPDSESTLSKGITHLGLIGSLLRSG